MFDFDLVLGEQLPQRDSLDFEVWAEWIVVACGKREYLVAMKEVGFRKITILTECLYDGLAMISVLTRKIISLELKASNTDYS